ncbi:hypothetical protein MMIC_P1599 [Mariprofundus micogutta]|uniref:Uncharacterized protein n=1 Tax=Mariprofundus micogutta TaxID=1921010 RepID=A0A1L8CNZ9_9PROT|nr:hypothetical protein [Mariprofundus micogutta]GAV20627.1 hypothetical protein MMIC_P1599 [Mariprofundus micogutta]
MRKVVMTVKGMDSPEWQGVAEQCLSVIDGVINVKATPKSGEILIIVDHGFSLIRIFKELRNLGLSFAGRLRSSEIAHVENCKSR